MDEDDLAREDEQAGGAGGEQQRLPQARVVATVVSSARRRRRVDRRGRRAHRQYDGPEPHRDAHARPGAQARREPERRQDDVRAEQRAERAARGVRAVQDGHAALAALGRPGDARHERQRRPHRDRRQEDDPARRARRGRAPSVESDAVPAAIEAYTRATAAKSQRRQCARHADGDLEHAVDEQRLAYPPVQPGGPRGTERQPGHEGDEHRARRVGGRPEREGQVLEEDDLVDEAHRTRREVKQRQCGGG